MTAAGQAGEKVAGGDVREGSDSVQACDDYWMGQRAAPKSTPDSLPCTACRAGESFCRKLGRCSPAGILSMLLAPVRTPSSMCM